MVKKIKILAIAPYPGMSELLTQISQTRQDAEITVRLGNLNDGLDIAENLLQHNSYDVILSRGGTAELLKKSLSAFVVESMTSSVVLKWHKIMEENLPSRDSVELQAMQKYCVICFRLIQK